MRSIATFAVAALVLPAGLLFTRSEAASAAPAPAPAPVSAPAGDPVSGSFEIDPVHSTLLFAVRHADAGRFWGRFNGFKGKLVVDAAKPEASSVVVEVSAESVDTANDGRDQHLRGPDFFNAKEFPEIVFESKKVARSAKGFQVSGELSMLGVTKEVSAEAEYLGYSEGERTGKRTGYEVRFTIQRTAFGMDYMVGPGLGDEIQVVFSLEAVK